MRTYFFQATADTKDQLTDLFDFVWPTAAALWNLRWQVSGYVNEVPGVNQAQLLARFVAGSDIHGVNLRRSCIEMTWNQQQEQFATIILTNLFALYESWIDTVLYQLNLNPDKNKGLGKALQFPTGGENSGKKPNGVREALALITTPHSAMLREDFYPALKNNGKYSGPQLDNLLHCYRYFKEMRNCIIHHGGKADNKTVTVYTTFADHVRSPQDLGMTDHQEIPECFPAVFNQGVRLSLRGVVGFGDVIERILTTLDAELAQAAAAEAEIDRRWARFVGKNPAKTLSSQPARRETQLKSLARKLGFNPPIEPLSLENFDQYLRAKNFIG